jgi:hypothetical protein
MKDHADNIIIGLILLNPGIYLLWYASGHPNFYRDKRWENWSWFTRARGVGLLLTFIYRYGGAIAVKRSLQVFAVVCIGVWTWAIFAV